MPSTAETLGSIGPATPFDLSKMSGSSSLRIMATTDLHVHLAPWDYYRDRRNVGYGLAQTANLIRIARAQVDCSLLFDNGDFLQGNPLGDLVASASSAEEAGRHPMIAAMNALHYDAATLGNHEFSHGLEFLRAAMAGAGFPIVSANLALSLGSDPLKDHTFVPATALLTRTLVDDQGRKLCLTIGVIGLAPPQTVVWERQSLGDALFARDIVEAAAAHVPALRAAGADIVVALSHSGIGDSVASLGMENATAALATLPGIDVLIAGHTHQTFPSPDFPASFGIDPEKGLLWGKPAVMPGFHGSHLGVIDLILQRQGGAWRVVGSHSELRPIARRNDKGKLLAVTRSAPRVLSIAAGAHRATRTWAMAAIGHSDRALHGYFAMVAPAATVRIVAQAQANHVKAALCGTAWADLPIVSAAAPFHAGGRGGPENYTFIEAGPLTMRHAFDLYPHPNKIAAITVNGEELRLWLERSFSQFFQIAPGAKDADLIDPDFPSFNFDTIEGLSWTVDLTEPRHFDSHGAVSAPGARRIRDLNYLGAPVDPNRRFVLATNSHRAGGSGHFPGALPDRIVLSGPDDSRAALVALVAQNIPLPPPGPPNWHFRPIPGTSVVFDTAPAARGFEAELAFARAEALPVKANGFRGFRLHL